MGFQKIHIIDGNSARRAGLARAVYQLDHHPEIYEDMEDFCLSKRSDGLVFLNSDVDRSLTSGQVRLDDALGDYRPVVMYSENPKAEEVVEALQAGAVDYLDWPLPLIEFEVRLRSVQERARRREGEELQRLIAKQQVSELTKRETQVLRSMINGSSNKDIADELGISFRTVEIHRANMLQKLRVSSSSSAVRIGIYAGLDHADLEQSYDPPGLFAEAG